MLNHIFVETVLKYVEITFFVRHEISTKDEYTEHILALGRSSCGPGSFLLVKVHSSTAERPC